MNRSMRRSVWPFASTAICLVIAACGSSAGLPPSSARGPSASVPPPASGEAPPAGSAAPSTQPEVSIPVDSYARVVTNDLRVRSKPGVSDDSKKLKPLLQDGVELVVLAGPVEGSGYDWYLVQPITPPTEDEDSFPFGWVAAAGKDGEPWIAPEQRDCPQMPTDLESLRDRDFESLVEIACFGGEDITFQARVGHPEIQCGIESPWGIDPGWLDSCMSSGNPMLVSKDGPDRAEVWPIWEPGVDTSLVRDFDTPIEDWPIVKVTGMFDHPEAKTCRSRVNYEEPSASEPPSPDWVVLQCRLEFVVTSMREIDG